MPCSRTPNQRFLPARFSGLTAGFPETVVLLEVARSADPPMSSGKVSARLLMTFPEAARAALADHRPAKKHARASGLRAGSLERFFDRQTVMSIHFLGVPSISIKTLLNILAEGHARGAVERDLVVVIKANELAEAEVPCEG